MKSGALLAAGVFAFGAVVMLAFDSTLARIAGVALLLGGIALGVFAIATPEFVAGEDAETEDSR